MKIELGATAFDFALFDTQKNLWRLSERIGRVVALLFYPGDETLVCTRQLCSVRDNWAKYMETGAEVVGISPGPADRQNRFAEFHKLPLPLLGDLDRAITAVYGKHRIFPIWTTRAVIVIDAKGFIRYRNVMVRALRPSDDEILTAINMAKYDVMVDKRINAKN